MNALNDQDKLIREYIMTIRSKIEDPSTYKTADAKDFYTDDEINEAKRYLTDSFHDELLAEMYIKYRWYYIDVILQEAQKKKSKEEP